MHGIGPPIVTPFTEAGALDESALDALVEWVQDRGVDFLVAPGSTSEAELLTERERERVVERVVDAADVPVVAGTGHPGFEATRRATAHAADVGADAALVVTPFYYDHDDETLEAYYRDIADAADIPIYLYSVPVFTGVDLDPDVVGRLATHPNVAGIKDSSGDLEALGRIHRQTADTDFDVVVGAGGVLAHALDAGADGGILALANVAPEATVEVYDRHRDGDHAGARELAGDLVELNRAVTTAHGIPGLKAAMRARGAPAGHARRPFRPVDDAAREELTALVAEL